MDTLPAARACETPKNVCGRAPVQPRLATKDKEKIFLSGGHVPTVVWSCECGWKRMLPLFRAK
jgi:hypothetical protein